MATDVAGDFLRASKTFFTDGAVISEVILSCFSTWIENKMMTTAPSAPATVTPPWLAQRRKAWPRGAAKAGEAPQGSLLSFCRIQVCTCRSGSRSAVAETRMWRERTECPAAMPTGTGVTSSSENAQLTPAGGGKVSPMQFRHCARSHQAITFSHLTPKLGTRQSLAPQCPVQLPEGD